MLKMSLTSYVCMYDRDFTFVFLLATPPMPFPSPDEKWGGLGREYSNLPVKLTWAGAVQLGPLLHGADRRQPLHHARVLMANPQHTWNSLDYENTKRASRTDQDDKLARTWFIDNRYMEYKGNKWETTYKNSLQTEHHVERSQEIVWRKDCMAGSLQNLDTVGYKRNGLRRGWISC
jgi:hypothetical protein